MKVNVNAQLLCVPREGLRGQHFYLLELLEALSRRRNTELSVSFFDYQRQRNNKEYILEYLGDYFDQSHMLECNEISYKSFSDYWLDNYNDDLKKRRYSTYFGEAADVYFFPQITVIPNNIDYKNSIVTVHDMFAMACTQYREELKSKSNASIERFENIVRYISRRKDINLVADSEATKKDLIEFGQIDGNRINVVPLGYNKNKYYAEENVKVINDLGIKKSYLLYLGAIQSHKGIDVLLRSFEMVREDVCLVIAGGTTDRFDIRPLYEENKRKQDIILTGYVSDEQKRVLLSMAEIFVFPSYYEGFGLPVLEAMACGTPVITTNSSSLPEVGGGAAMYVEAGNSDELAACIDKLLGDTILREGMIKKGYENCEQFAWDKTAEMMEDVFEHCRQTSLEL